jgi:hypothetical protein
LNELNDKDGADGDEDDYNDDVPLHTIPRKPMQTTKDE